MKFKMSLLGILMFAFFQAKSSFKFLDTKPKQNSPSLFIFYKPDCPYCIKLDEEITSNHQFSSYHQFYSERKISFQTKDFISKPLILFFLSSISFES